MNLIDIDGKDLQVGDWVRVIAVPLSISDMQTETKDAFSRAVGETLQIESVDESGCLELDFWPKLGFDTIWIEPDCVRRFRRYKELSSRFKKKLALSKELDGPKFTFSCKASWPENGSFEESMSKIQDNQMYIGNSWKVWPEERRMEGDFTILQHRKNSLEKIKECREYVRALGYFENIEVGEIES